MKQMKKKLTLTAIALGVVVIAVLTVMYTKAENQPDSVRQACEAFDEAVQATEKNNAVYAYLMKHGFESEYTTMKDSLLTELNNGSMTAQEAMAQYILWFNNFDRHNMLYSDDFYFAKLMLSKSGLINYEETIPQYAPQPVGCKVDDDTYLLRLPSCEGENPTWEWMLQKKEEFLKSGCQYLILDVRGNSGGSDKYSSLFAEMMCDTSTLYSSQLWYLNSKENNKELERLYEASSDTTIAQVLAEARDKPEGTLIKWYDTVTDNDNYTPKVLQGAIIIDNFTCSAGESAVRIVRQFSKSHAKVYGREGTMGGEHSGNCNFIQLTKSDMTIQYPICVMSTIEEVCKSRKPGHQPDIIIPLPYPDQLTDNIDPWVLWVAKDMKKQ